MWLVVARLDVNSLIRAGAGRSGRICGEANFFNVKRIHGVSLACAVIFLRLAGLMTLRNFRKQIARKTARNFKWKGTLLGLPKIIRSDTQQNRVLAASQYIEAPNVNAHRREADGE
jgi:hypothetical protein